jgi:hypothetical protein
MFGWCRSYRLFHYTLEFALQLRKRKENLSVKPASVRHKSLRRLGRLLWTALTGLLSISSSLLPVSDFCQPLVGTSVFQGAELKGYPHRLTSSQTSDVIGKKRNPQNLANLPVANVPRYVNCNAKTRVCNILSFCTLVWAADLQTGHA